MRKPQGSKTDDGPAYTRAAFRSLCRQCNTQRQTGTPCTARGPALVEQSHQLLTQLLDKQKGGDILPSSPRRCLHLAPYTLNF